MDEYTPFVSINSKKYRINIGSRILKLLGNPAYVTIYRNEDLTSIAIGSCEADNVMSFRTPIDREASIHHFTINSKQFISDVMLRNNLPVGRSYRINGTYLSEKNMVTFNMKEAVEISDNSVIE